MVRAFIFVIAVSFIYSLIYISLGVLWSIAVAYVSPNEFTSVGQGFEHDAVIRAYLCWPVQVVKALMILLTAPARIAWKKTQDGKASARTP